MVSNSTQMGIVDLVKYTLKRGLQNIALKGDNMICPCCNHSFVTFLPCGVVSKTSNLKCPNCGSNARGRGLFLFIQKNSSLFFDSMSLLHAAPEPMLYKYFIRQHYNYIPGDLFPKNYGKKTKRIDLTNIPFEDRYLDAIICSHVLEHIPDDKKAMTEMYRCLKVNGWAILNVPLGKQIREKTYEDFSIIDPKERLKHFGQEDHVRVYGKDYFDRLRSVGFNVEIIDLFNQLTSEETYKYGLKQQDLIILARKSKI